MPHGSFIMKPLISVIIPAYNAHSTIAATIASVQRQSCSDLEIIVIDDGSSDETSDIVRGLQGQDARVGLIRQENGGVSRARNAGIAVARGRYVALLDGDDIWHPLKLERQVARFDAASGGVGLVYCWYRRIDLDDRVYPNSPAACVEGWVYHRHLEWNFVSNGSTPMVPTELARTVGFETALHDATGQGCEDYLFQLRIARTHRFACVPAYLTGYRRVDGSLSRDIEGMIRWHLKMYDLILADGVGHGPAGGIVARRQAQLLVELARNRLRRGHLAEAATHLLRALRYAPASVPSFVAMELRAAWRRLTPAPAPIAPGRDFLSYGVEEPDGTWMPARSASHLARLERCDHAMEAAG